MADTVQNVAEKPAADDTIEISGESFRRFHPVHRPVKDGTPRCVSCGQIDEPEYHVREWCPGAGGALPFPTSTLKLRLKADSGFTSTSEHRLTIDQWFRINAILGEAA